MENASKALLMAASVLIGTIILSLAAYLYISFSSSANEMGKQMEEGQLQQFNNRFTSYVDKEDLTIYDVVTVANLARDNNRYYGLSTPEDNNYYIQVICKELSNISIETKADADLKGYLEANDTNNYTCSVEYNQNTGRINKITFNKNPL